jgi:hypothetical protein
MIDLKALNGNSMKKLQRVELLSVGDRFAFLSGPNQAPGKTMIVTRKPAVKATSNSCHFRYQVERSSPADANEWQDNESWNGSLGVLVRIIDGPPAEVGTV